MLEKGQVITGKVINVTSFGAFIRVDDTNPPITGYCHVSQLDTCFVKNIHEHIAKDDVVTAKVMECKPDNKFELSIKQYKFDVQRASQNDNSKSGGEVSEFETMFKTFMKKSEDRQVDLRRNEREKRGEKKKRRH